MPKLEVPEGWVAQAYQFALDPTPEQDSMLRRHFGARRFAYNWAVATMRADIEAWQETGAAGEKPSLGSLRKRWNQAKDGLCVNAETGELWWQECSKEAYSDGITGAVDAYWNWQSSRAGNRGGKRVGFPRFKKKTRDIDRVTFTTGAMRVEEDRRHLTLPRIGRVRTHENTRRIERLLRGGQARLLAVTVRRRGHRFVASLRVIVQRPIQPRVARPESRVGVDVGVRVLATVGSADGTVLERVENPRPLEANLRELRTLMRARSRCTRGSRQYAERTHQISRLLRRIADVRAHHLHVLTTRLAKTHGVIVVEGLDAAGLLRQKGLNGARARRRGLSDASLGEPRRQLAYKARWYGSELVVADRWYPSSKLCSGCGHKQDLGWAEHWTCAACGAAHQRDDNAAVNLARWDASQCAVGPVGAAVKRGADRKTGPSPAGGCEARKGGRLRVAEQPRDGVLVA